MQEESIIHLRMPAALKGAWVMASRSRGMKLGDWIIQRVNMSTDFDGFSLGVSVFLPFERYVLALTDDEARAVFKRVRSLDARVMQEDGAAYCDVKIAKSYLEKRVALADGMAHPHLLHDINVDALNYFSKAPYLTHEHLIATLSQKP